MEAALAIAYGLVALLAMIPTRLERHANGISGLAPCLLGMAACILWPLTLAGVTIEALRARQDGAGALRD